MKQTFKTHLHLGNSAFLWEFWLVIISVILTVVAFALPLILSLPWAKTCLEQTTLTCPDTTAICGFVLSFCCGLATLLVTSVIFFYFYQFIVPIMYLCKIKALQATGIFWNLFITKPLVFVKYLILIVILKLCLSVAIVLALIVLLLITCCLAAIPLAILYVLLFLPYVWVTLLLPMLVFFRLCGLELLNQIYKNQDLAIWAEESHQENNNADPEDIQAS